jgi:hypothetical protein
MKSCVLSKESTWHWSYVAHYGRNWSKMEFKDILSEIFMKIKVFSSLELNYTNASIAQLQHA